MKLSLKIVAALVAGIACSTVATAQTRNLPGPNLPNLRGSAEGQLTVTLTIVSSVGVVMDAEGQPKLMVANGADPADNVSKLNEIHLVDASQAQQKGSNKKRKRK